jgi:ferredoxin
MAKYAVIIDRETCIGCGMCEELDQKHFELSPDNKVQMKKAEVDEKDLAKVKDAEKNCPARSIHVKKK